MLGRILPWLVLVACRINDLDLSTKECPCPTGWSCNAMNLCQLGFDASVDSVDSDPADAQTCWGTGLLRVCPLVTPTGTFAPATSSIITGLRNSSPQHGNMIWS